MSIANLLHLIGGIGLIHAGRNQQLAYLDGIEVEFVSYRLERGVAICTVDLLIVI